MTSKKSQSLSSFLAGTKDGAMREDAAMDVLKSILINYPRNSGNSLSPDCIFVGPEGKIIDGNQEPGTGFEEVGFGEMSFLYRLGLLGLFMLYGKPIFPNSDPKKFVVAIEALGFLPNPEEIGADRVKSERSRRHFTACANTVILGLLDPTADRDVLHGSLHHGSLHQETQPKEA